MKSIRYHLEPMLEIDKRRIDAGISIVEVCDMLGVRDRTWYRWKNGGATTMKLFQINRALTELELRKKATKTLSEP